MKTFFILSWSGSLYHVQNCKLGINLTNIIIKQLKSKDDKRDIHLEHRLTERFYHVDVEVVELVFSPPVSRQQAPASQDCLDCPVLRVEANQGEDHGEKLLQQPSVLL